MEIYVVFDNGFVHRKENIKTLEESKANEAINLSMDAAMMMRVREAYNRATHDQNITISATVTDVRVL